MINYYDNPNRLSFIKMVRWEQTSEVSLFGDLFVIMTKNSYVFHDISFELFDDFIWSRSLGEFFNENIRGKYETERIEWKNMNS
jgi:hypothetical protein